MNEDTYFTASESGEVHDAGYRLPPLPPLETLPPAERPRERLWDRGPEALSDQELLAVALNTGQRNKPVGALAEKLLDALDRRKEIPSVKELAGIAGLGQSKAGAVVSLLEFGRRRWGIAGTRVKHPSDIYGMVRHFADRRQERFICVSLNGAYETLALRIVTIGLVNRTIVHPREVFADPILDRACAVAVAHNHPSGQLSPSPEDERITIRLKEAADVLGIRFLDHLIFTETGYYSYCQDGKIPSGPRSSPI